MRWTWLILVGLTVSSCGEALEDLKNEVNKEIQKELDNAEDMNSEESSETDYPYSNSLMSPDKRTAVFYNVENLFDTKDDPFTSDDDFTPDGYKEWTSERYFKKVDDLVKVFSSISDDLPMLIGLSEIENKDVLIDLIAHQKMKMAQYQIVHDESPDARGIDVALLFDENRFNYIEHESIRINFPWNENIKTRDILHVTGEIIGNEKIHVFVNHWPSRRDGKKETEVKRLEVAGKLRDRIDLIFEDEDNPKILILGDFNDSPEDKSVAHVLRATNNVNSGQTDLFNLSYQDFSSGEGSLVHDNKWEMLDQIMCSKGFLNTGATTINDKAELFNPDWILYKGRDGNSQPNKTYGGQRYYGGYSDHLPTYVTFKHQP